jgi:hypothetical protein
MIHTFRTVVIMTMCQHGGGEDTSRKVAINNQLGREIDGGGYWEIRS